MGLVGGMWERTWGQHSCHSNMSLHLCPQTARDQGLKLLSHPPLQRRGKCVCVPESKNETYMFKLASSVFVIEL